MGFMSDAEWRQVPIRLDAERWTTRPGCRRVLVAVHSVTTAQRLLDVVRPLEGAQQVQVFFTAVPDVFSNGVTEFLDGLRAVTLPWHQAVQTSFDLAFAAGHEGIHELHAPVVIVPHGAGHNKFIAGGRPGRATERGVYGLSRQWLVRDGAVVPEAILLAHEEDLARLGRHCPEALPAAAVVGDPSYDRIRASLPQRALYRSALDVGPDRKLVAVTSTWGPRSLFARALEVVDRLAAELPRDEYRLTMLLHPNAWNTHGEWQVRAWLAQARRAGLALVSQHSDWCGALVAADCVVGDHGSTTLYGAAAGAPVVLAHFAEEDVDPGSPMGELGTLAPRLNPGRSLSKQITRACADHPREDLRRVAERISSEPGRFLPNMRTLIYRKLRLRAPAACPVMEPAAMPVLVQDADGGWRQ
jgi:hypothetical protein